jgi:TolB-like protein
VSSRDLWSESYDRELEDILALTTYRGGDG